MRILTRRRRSGTAASKSGLFKPPLSNKKKKRRLQRELEAQKADKALQEVVSSPEIQEEVDTLLSEIGEAERLLHKDYAAVSAHHHYCSRVLSELTKLSQSIFETTFAKKRTQKTFFEEVKEIHRILHTRDFSEDDDDSAVVYVELIECHSKMLKEINGAMKKEERFSQHYKDTHGVSVATSRVQWCINDARKIVSESLLTASKDIQEQLGMLNDLFSTSQKLTMRTLHGKMPLTSVERPIRSRAKSMKSALLGRGSRFKGRVAGLMKRAGYVLTYPHQVARKRRQEKKAAVRASVKGPASSAS